MIFLNEVDHGRPRLFLMDVVERRLHYRFSSHILVIGSDREYAYPFLDKIPASMRAFAAD